MSATIRRTTKRMVGNAVRMNCPQFAFWESSVIQFILRITSGRRVSICALDDGVGETRAEEDPSGGLISLVTMASTLARAFSPRFSMVMRTWDCALDCAPGYDSARLQRAN